MKPKAQNEFEVVDISEVPSAEPVSDRPVNPTGSQWDDALQALADGDKVAIRIEAHGGRTIPHLMQTLKTRATNLQIGLEVRRSGDCFYAWQVERFGRFAEPKNPS